MAGTTHERLFSSDSNWAGQFSFALLYSIGLVLQLLLTEDGFWFFCFAYVCSIVKLIKFSAGTASVTFVAG